MVGKTRFDFTGESAIVTGSTKGIGRGIAERLVDAGANVTINARTEEDVKQAVNELDETASGRVIGVSADIADPEGVERLVSESVDAFNEIDLLVNNAAVWPREESMVTASLEDWDYTMDVNVRSQFYAAKLVAEHMIENGIEGSIVNHSSQTGDRRSGPRGLYGISNTSVNGLTWRMAHDLAPHGIRMNAVSTDLTESYQSRWEAKQEAEHQDEATVEGILDEWGDERPAGRLGQPEDIAHAVLYLASDKADYVIGDILRVSGGGNLQ
ncbi:SDR family NAD(P)-dependent oxidoreductase [Halosimplex amylolyticum]|uniref:SDR family NAD(P)-dependent oxidoreductase n=1 Tax=Halosimplex amylolyticum TaxID=3396616 RepID=UPI003F54FFA1